MNKLSYTKPTENWDFELMTAQEAQSLMTDSRAVSAGYKKTLYYIRKDRNYYDFKVFSTNDENLIEIRFYSTETPNEAFRIGQKRCRGRIHDINKSDTQLDNDGFLLTIDSSKEKNGDLYDFLIDDSYLSSINAKSILIYYYEKDTSFSPKESLIIPVDEWLSAMVYINKRITIEALDEEDKLVEFDIDDYVRIVYITEVEYQEIYDPKTKKTTYSATNILGTASIDARIESIIPESVVIAKADGSTREEVIYKFILDISTYHNYITMTITSPNISSITRIEPPVNKDVREQIKDANFRKAIRTALGLDKDDEEEPITIDDVESIETLDVSGYEITSLEGINLFTNLIFLDCSHNELEAISLSLPLLQVLHCDYNELRGLTLSNCPLLEYVDCTYNVIPSSTNEFIYIGDKQSLTIDKNLMYTPQKKYVHELFDPTVIAEIREQLQLPANAKVLSSDCELIVSLYLDGKNYLGDGDKKTEENKNNRTKIKSLNGLEYCVNLSTLVCPNNDISVLDLTNNTNIRHVDISYNKLRYNSTITTNGVVNKIDLSKCTELEYFDCRYNYIEDESYIIKPPQKINYDGEYVDSIDTFLFYPQIDDVTSKFVDEKLKQAIKELLELEFDDMILKSDLVGITELDISNRQIRSLKGLEYFVDLEILYCQDNLLEELEFSAVNKLDLGDTYKDICPNLAWIECQNNNIRTIGLYNLLRLNYLNCNNNKITSFEILNCNSLEQVLCSNNSLSLLRIDSSGSNTADYENLIELDCSNNKLLELDLSLFPNLRNLYCDHNELSYLGIYQCPFIMYLQCSFNKISAIRLDACNDLVDLKMTNNCLIELDLGLCYSIASVDVTYNYIDDISYITNIPSGCTVLYDPQMKNITHIFDGKLLPIIRNLLGVTDIWNYDCLSITKLEINGRSISKLDGIEYFLNLEELYCANNRLVSIDLTNNENMRIINCANNQISDINIYGLTKLEEIYCNNNNITSIDLSYCDNLWLLNIEYNKLTYLDVNDIKTLQKLQCSNNNLTELDINHNTELVFLSCSYNKLMKLDVSNNIFLEEIYCNNNLIQEFDPRGRIKLIKLDCSNNLLQELCIKTCFVLKELNCSHNILTELDVTSREELQILNCSYNSMVSKDKVYIKNKYLEDINNKNFIFNPQITDVGDQFTDPIFAKYIRDILGITIDDPIMYYDCANITEIDVSNMGIRSLHGIEYFVNLTKLDCSYNLLTKIDVSKNELLVSLSCSYNYMVTLDDIARIKQVLLDENIDFIPQYKIINDYFTDPVFARYVRDRLGITDEQDILDQKCLDIKDIDVSHMDIHYLNGIEWLPNIKYLYCSYNLLEEIDISKNTLLEHINCSYNHLETIDASNCTHLDSLYCDHNNMEDEADVKLPVSEDYDINIYALEFGVQNIRINDKFTDYLFKNKIISMNDFVHKDVLTDYVASRINVLDLNGKNVDEEYKYKNIDGIEYFVNLVELDCSYNIIEHIDLRNCRDLKLLNCSHNWLSDLKIDTKRDTDNNDYIRKLEKLDCSYNDLRAVGVSNFTELVELDCSYNNKTLNTVNMVDCIKLEKVNCSHNKMISMVATGCTALRQLYCNHNQIYRIDISDCIALEELYCYDNAIPSLDISKCESLVYLHCYNNRINELDVTQNSNLTQLDCHNNYLTKLDIHDNESIQYVYCFYNNLIGLDVGGCTSLEFLNCSYNTIRYITNVINRPDSLVENDNFIYEPQNTY